MFKLYALILPSLVFASNTFVIGRVKLTGSSFQLQSTQLSGSTPQLGPILSTQSGEQLIFSYNFTAQNLSNQSVTFTNLSSSVFTNSATPIVSVLYQTSNTLSSIKKQPLTSQHGLYFLENQSTSSQVVSLFLSKQTGQQLGSGQVIFPFSSQTFTLLQTGALSGDNMVFNALTSSGQWQNKSGNYKSFPSFSLSPCYVISNTSQLSTTSHKELTLSAFAQNLSGLSSIAYVKQTKNGFSEPTIISDNLETSVNFLSFDKEANYLFFADNTVQGPRLGACQVLPNSSLSKPIYFTASYSYQSSTGFKLYETGAKRYLIFYGNGLVYNAEFDVSLNKWVGLYSGPSTLGTQTLPLIIQNPQSLFFAVSQAASYGYNVNSYLFYKNLHTFSTPSGGTPQALNIYPNTYASGTTIPGTVGYFYQPAQVSSASDNSHDTITLFSGSLGGLSQILYNVYDAVNQTYSGMIGLNSGTVSSIGTFSFLSSATQTAIIWSANNSGSWALWGALYQPNLGAFGTPTQLYQGFSSAPQLLVSESSQSLFFSAGL